MPEPDQLDDFMNGLPPASPLPAAEVRRRGDRLRRRNTALSVTGVVVAAALVVGGPVIALSGDRDDSVGPVAPSPASATSPSTSADWLQTVPSSSGPAEGFPSPHDGPSVIDSVGDRAPSADLVPVCGSQAWSLEGSLDAHVVSRRGAGSEDQSYRTIALYPDDRAAQAALQALHDAVTACPATNNLVYAPVAVDLSFETATEESFSFSEQAKSDDLLSDLTVVEVARTGNALLFDSGFGSVGGDQAVAQETKRLKDLSDGTRTEMCIFAAAPCSSDPGVATSASASATGPTSGAAPGSASGDIAGSLDLLAGAHLGSDSTIQSGPGRDADGVSLADLCGTSAWPPAGETDRLAVVATAPEYQLNRELVTFADADQAAAALQAVRDAVAACPVAAADNHDDDKLFDQTDADTGYDDVTFAQTYRAGLGGGIYQFVQEGRAVLASVESGELGPGSVGPAVRSLTHENAAVTALMCTFTAAGC